MLPVCRLEADKDFEDAEYILEMLRQVSKASLQSWDCPSSEMVLILRCVGTA